MKPYVYLLLFLGHFSFIFPAEAQTLQIKGRLSDTQQQELPFATVHLLNAADSTVKSSAFSDEQGAFVFSGLQPGSYRIQAQMVGYQDGYSEKIELSGSQTVQELPTLVLETGSELLEEVVIDAPQRALVERKADRLVVNVENSTLAAGNTALDILKRSPGVSLDKDDQISLLGKQGVTVMIDGKQTYLSSEQLADLLRSTDGSSIKSIELISNPSSKYDASGTAGIINIVLKKNRMQGSSGTLTLGGGYGKEHKSNGSLQLNHRQGPINAFVNYSMMDNGSVQEIDILRSVSSAGSQTVFDQSTRFNRNFRNYSYRAGLDYNTSERNVLGMKVSGFRSKSENGNYGRTWIGSAANQLDSTLLTQADFAGRYTSISGNLNNTFSIDTNGHKLVTELDVSRFSNANNAAYNNTFRLPSGDLLGSPLLSRSSMPTIIDIAVAKADYTLPFNADSKLEAGLKYSGVKADNDMVFESQSAGEWQDDAGRTNHFIYKEQVAAAYLNYSVQLGDWGVQAGLRAEYTQSDGNSVTLEQRVKRDYLDLFPSVFVNRKLGEAHELGLSYSKRINRPNYGNLNPFAYFLDQYTSEQGNPYLGPEYTHAFEFSYTLLQRYHLSAGYSQTNDVIAESMVQDDEHKTTWVTRANLARQRVWFANFNVPVQLASWWSSQNNINGFYMGFEGGLGEAYLKQGQYALQIYSNQSFKISPTFSAEASFNYQSPLVYSIYRVGQQWSLDAGVSKSLFNKKANIKLSLSDIFNTGGYSVKTNYSNLNVNVFQRPETRVARLTLTYNFGSMKNGKSSQESKSEEKSRVGMP